MNKLEIFKGATELVVSSGVSAIVGNVIKLTTVPDAKLIKRISVGISGIVLSSMVGEMASKYATDRIDNAAARVNYILHGEAKDADSETEDNKTQEDSE